MSFAYPGITHCANCGTSLSMNEHYYCKRCDEEEDRKRQKFEQEKKEKELKNQIKEEVADIMKEFTNVMAESKTISNIENLKFDSMSLSIVPHKPNGISYDEWYASIGFNIISMYNMGQKDIKVQFIEKEEIEEEDNNEEDS